MGEIDSGFVSISIIIIHKQGDIMKLYGIRIGDYGVEFSELDNRTETLNKFIQGSSVRVNSTGIRYSAQGETCFGTYERNAEDTDVICYECKGVFNIDVCHERSYQSSCSWRDGELEDRKNHICDGCLAVKQKEVKDFVIKQTAERIGTSDDTKDDCPV